MNKKLLRSKQNSHWRSTSDINLSIEPNFVLSACGPQFSSQRFEYEISFTCTAKLHLVLSWFEQPRWTTNWEPLCIESLRLLTTLLMTSFSSIDRFDLMHKCGGKDVYFNDGTVVKDAFEGFLGPGLERLNSWYEVLLYYIEPLYIESLRLFTTLSCFHVTIRRGHWGLLHTVSSHTL